MQFKMSKHEIEQAIEKACQKLGILEVEVKDIKTQLDKISEIMSEGFESISGKKKEDQSDPR